MPREQVFITTKLWNNSHHPDDVEAALDASLKDLGVDYIDLYLMHWPSPFARSSELMPKTDDGKGIKPGDTDYIDTYRAMEKCFKSGKAKAIGISNFSKAELERLLQNTSVVPAAHQIECHPWLQQRDFFEWQKSKGIHVTQYSPFGNQNEIYSGGQNMGKLIEDPTLTEIGKKYGKTGAQVALAWGIAHGRTVIPKSKTESRIKQNLEGDFKLEAEDVEKIDGIDKKVRPNRSNSSCNCSDTSTAEVQRPFREIWMELLCRSGRQESIRQFDVMYETLPLSFLVPPLAKAHWSDPALRTP